MPTLQLFCEIYLVEVADRLTGSLYMERRIPYTIVSTRRKPSLKLREVIIENVTRPEVGVRLEAGVSTGAQIHVWEITSFASIVVEPHLTKLRFSFNVATKLDSRPEVKKFTLTAVYANSAWIVVLFWTVLDVMVVTIVTEHFLALSEESKEVYCSKHWERTCR